MTVIKQSYFQFVDLRSLKFKTKFDVDTVVGWYLYKGTFDL